MELNFIYHFVCLLASARVSVSGAAILIKQTLTRTNCSPYLNAFRPAKRRKYHFLISSFVFPAGNDCIDVQRLLEIGEIVRV